MQAEACVTSGGCNNFIGGDASQNGYTGRGSGTSYATPAVTGIIALMMEVNDEIDPLVIREILRSTATRMGEASQPEHDPHWNKDFGWGLVHGHDAVWTAEYLNITGMSTSDMNLDLQVHIENISSEGTVNTYTGLAWSRGAVMEKIEYSTDGGETWTEVVYKPVEGALSTYESFEFKFTVDTDNLPSGYNMIIVRGVDADGASSMISWDSAVGGGNVISMASGDSFGRTMFIATVGLVVILFGAWVAIRKNSDEPLQLAVISEKAEATPPPIDGEPLEAVIIDDATDNGSS